MSCRGLKSFDENPDKNKTPADDLIELMRKRGMLAEEEPKAPAGHAPFAESPLERRTGAARGHLAALLLPDGTVPPGYNGRVTGL